MENGEESGINDCLIPEFYNIMNHNENKFLTLLHLSMTI